MDYFEILRARCDALGDAPTEAQLAKLQSWILEEFGVLEFPAVMDIVSEYGLGFGDLYTDMSMRCGEMGIHG